MRLKGYDYTQAGAYLVTVCTHGRMCIFGKIEDSMVQQNGVGRLVDAAWEGVAERFEKVELDEFIVMPNHLHGIIVILDATEKEKDRTEKRLGDIVGAFKSIVIYEYIVRVRRGEFPPFDRRLWQRNYHDHIIHSEKALNAVRQYIIMNPLRWSLDHENPARQGRPPRIGRSVT